MTVFTALFTVMAGFYIRMQTLTYTKSNAERLGPLLTIAKTIERYNTGAPTLWCDDDPSATQILLRHFSSLWDKFRGTGAAMAACRGLKELKLPEGTKVLVLDAPDDIEALLKGWCEKAKKAPVVLHIDCEWNMTRTEGVSVLQVAEALEDSGSNEDPAEIYLLRVRDPLR